MFYTYILQSQKSGRYYIGHTADLKERLNRHNSGLVTATRNKGPWKIVYFEVFNAKLAANQRELSIKKMKSRIYIEKLIQSQQI
ncbi:MAG: GIY-YIG nuclease family protein [Sphingobacteriales bacterium]|nr:GIY-YIG nuclease family protein [Sphingobacteriales bacterium]